jgi:hypothetical protein
MMRLAIALIAATCAACINVSLLCPDARSTVTYRGLSLTSVSCVGSPLGGDTVQVTGLDIVSLAAAVAPLVAAKQPAAK